MIEEDVYGVELKPKKKENVLVRLWNKTIFSEKIKTMKERKAWERRLRAEAVEEVKPEMEKILKEKYKKEMIAKMKGEKSKDKKSVMEKLAEGFGADPKAPKKEFDIVGMMGMGSSTKKESGMGIGRLNTSDEKIKSMLGTSNKGEVLDEMIYKKKKTKSKKKKTKKKHTKKDEEEKHNPFDVSEKITNMLK